MWFDAEIRPPTLILKNYARILVVMWTAMIIGFLVWEVTEHKRETSEAARIKARAVISKDMYYRRWAAMHGGVYVPVTEVTKPNPYLADIPERDILTPSGRLLTLVNPAYMTRQVHEMSKKEFGVFGHITSLKPVRPENAPDPWEAEALRAFERGEKEVSSLEKIEGQEYMRLMQPFVADKGCLKCHAKQGYREGDIRGGISVSVPMQRLRAIESEGIKNAATEQGLLWLAGMAVIFLGARRLRKSQEKYSQAANDLEQEKIFTDHIISSLPGPFYLLNREGRFIRGNNALEALTRRPEESLRGAKALSAIHPDDQRQVARGIRKVFKEGCAEMEARVVTAEGAVRDFNFNGRRMEIAGSAFLVGTGVDITDRKRAEEALRQSRDELEERVQERTSELQESQRHLQYLSSQLLVSQEEERRRIAQEVHDDLTQSLTAIKHRLEHLLQEAEAEIRPACARLFKVIIPILEQSVDSTRRIQNSLRPPVLDDLGILPAIGWYVREFGKQYPHIQLSSRIEVNEDDIPATLKTVIYRNLQEAMDNVLQHSGANRLGLSLVKSPHLVELHIRDNGLGFDVDKVLAMEQSKPGLGISSMRERTRISGGSFAVESAKGTGTTIRASWPC